MFGFFLCLTPQHGAQEEAGIDDGWIDGIKETATAKYTFGAPCQSNPNSLNWLVTKDFSIFAKPS